LSYEAEPVPPFSNFEIFRYGAQELFHDELEGTAAAAGGTTTDPAAAAEAAAAAARAAGATGAAVTEAAAAAAAAASARGRRIVWDDAAIERLLDRSDLIQGKAAADAGDAAGEEVNEDDEFTKAFKVANFEMVEQEEEAAAAAVEQEREGGDKPKEPEEPPSEGRSWGVSGDFWGNGGA
jgi:hypothetical protein